MLRVMRWWRIKNEYEDIDDVIYNQQYKRRFEEDKYVPYNILFKFASKWEIFLMITSMACTIFAAVIQPIFIILFGEACGQFISYSSEISNEAITPSEKQAFVNILKHSIASIITKTLVSGLSSMILKYIAILLWSYTIPKQVLKLRSQFLQNLFHQDISWFDTHLSKDLASVFSRYFTQIETCISKDVPICLYHAVVFLTGISMSLYINWKLGLICLSGLFICLVLQKIFTRVYRECCINQKQMNSFSISIAEEVFSAIRTVVAYCGQHEEIKRFSEHMKEVKKSNIQRIFLIGIGGGFLHFFTYAFLLITILFCVRMLVEEPSGGYKENSPEEIIPILLVSWFACWHFYQIIAVVDSIRKRRKPISRIQEVIDSVPKINISLKYGLRPVKCMGHLIFSKVFFNYPSQPSYTGINGVSFTIHPGQRVAFVGSPTSGKSAFFDLLQRFYDPSYGEISVDGNDLKDINLSWWRSQLSILETQPDFFRTTVSENIACGNTNFSQESIEVASKKAGAHDFIMKLEDGYETFIDQNSTFSREQKWRIGLARTVIRQPSVLLVDATSFLETLNISDVRKIIDEVTKNFTSIIIADHLRMVDFMENIYIFSEGSIDMQGTYHELNEAGILHDLFPSDNRHDYENQRSCKMETIPEEPMCQIQYQTDDEKLMHQSLLSKKNLVTLPQKAFTEDIGCFKMFSREWQWISCGAISSILTGVTYFLSFLFIMESLGEFYTENSTTLNTSTLSILKSVLQLGMICCVLYTIQILAYGISKEELNFAIKKKMFENILTKEISWFEHGKNSTSKLCSLLFDRTNALCKSTIKTTNTFFDMTTLVILGNATSIYIQPKLTLTLSIIKILNILGLLRKSHIGRQYSRSKLNIEEVSTEVAEDGLKKIKTVVAFGCEIYLIEKCTKQLEEFINSSKGHYHFMALYQSFQMNILAFVLCVGLFLGTNLIINGVSTYEYVILVICLQFLVIFSTAQLSNLIHYKHEINIAAKSLSEINRSKIEGNSTSFKVWRNGDVEFSNVHSTDSSEPERNILKGIDLSIPPGESIAIAGSEDSGKDMIMQLLAKFHRISDGKITVDDIDIDEINPVQYRKNVAFISREPHLFNRTIAENIGYGHFNQLVPSMEIMKAARNANIHDFIVSLPLGYDTPLGFQGSLLSVSQKQRIAIARALVRNPRILLLEGPTDLLSTDDEKMVRDALTRVKRYRTCIVTSNHLKKIRDTDIIYFFHEGRIVESGNHDNLMTKRGHYYSMYKLQSYN